MPMVAELALTIMKRAPLKAMCQAVEMMAQTDFYEIAPRLVCPSLVIVGSEDPASPPEMGYNARKALGDGPQETIEGAGLRMHGKPRRFNAALREFVVSTNL